MKIHILTAAMAAALTLCACAAPAKTSQTTASDISIKDAWARPASAMVHGNDAQSSGSHDMHGGMNSAAYMIIENKGGVADRLLGVSGDVAEVIEIHQTKQSDNGMITMQPLPDGIEIPANASVEIKPASYHIMLMGVKQDLKPGQTFKLMLKFKSGKEAPVDVTVREL
jgi:hypothetical protein